MRKRLRGTRRESGQAAVEFALMLPLLLLLICGMVEMAWFASTRQVLDTMAREGARAGIVASTASASTTAVNDCIDDMKPGRLTGPLSVTVQFSHPSSFKSGNITVLIKYDLAPLTPITAFLTKNGVFHIEASCTMKVA